MYFGEIQLSPGFQELPSFLRIRNISALEQTVPRFRFFFVFFYVSSDNGIQLNSHTNTHRLGLKMGF